MINVIQKSKKTDIKGEHKCLVESCSKSYSSKSALNKHLLKDHNINNRLLHIKCEVFDCEFKFKSKINLVQHLNLFHKKEEFFIQEKIFKNYEAFKNFKSNLGQTTSSNLDI